MMSIFDPQFNGMPGITNYRGDVDPSLAGGDHRPVRWESWPGDELKIFNYAKWKEIYGNEGLLDLSPD